MSWIDTEVYFQIEINCSMDNFQINHILSTTNYVKDIFMGVYTVDTLPKYVKEYPCCYIINTDESTDGGEHWVCTYFNSNGQGEFFCSFGNNPKFYDNRIVLFIERNCDSWICNTKRLQCSMSMVCGQYCIFFAVCKALHVTMTQFCNIFNRNCQINDETVNEFVCVNFDLNLPVVDIEFLKASLM